MKAHHLPRLREWEQFERFAAALQRLGWSPTLKADGPDARCWAFRRESEFLWLVFDDVLGGSLKTESQDVNMEAVATQVDACRLR